MAGTEGKLGKFNQSREWLILKGTACTIEKITEYKCPHICLVIWTGCLYQVPGNDLTMKVDDVRLFDMRIHLFDVEQENARTVFAFFCFFEALN